MDLKNIPMFDNHTHVLSLNATNLDPVSLASNFLHGYRDILPVGKDDSFKMSEDFKFHVANMGVVHSMVNQMAILFGCEPDISLVG
jgi:hypothetical protein